MKLVTIIFLFVAPSSFAKQTVKPNVDEPQKVTKKAESQANETSISSRLLDISILKFKDIPMLLKMAKSKKMQSPCPSNSLSSRHHATCSEGILAMWFIEGVRQGGRYPSLNAILLSTDDLSVDPLKNEKIDFQKKSQSHHDEGLRIYTEWWEEVKSDEKLMNTIDPLKGSKLVWH